MLRDFEITVPPGRDHAVELRVRVRADTWLDALAEAGRKLRDELGVTISDDQTDQLDRAIRVRELESGRQYVVSSLAGEVPKPAGRRARGGSRPTLLHANGDPREGPTRVLPRAQVQVRSPKLRRRGDRAVGGPGSPDPAATRLELEAVGARPPSDRVRTPPEWRRRRPVVRSDRLRPRPRPLHVTTPSVVTTGGGALFKPVTDLDLLPGDVESLIDAAVTMLGDHIPCAFVQAALWLDDREGLWVASALGHLADEARHAVLRLPPGFIPQGPEQEAPVTHGGASVAFAYEDEAGSVLRVDVDTALCVPIRVDGVAMGLFVLAGPEREAGFSKADVSGVSYLAKTIGAKIAAALASGDEPGGAPGG